MNHPMTCLLSAGFAAFIPLGSSAIGETPPRSESGQSLVVPKEHLDAADIYHIMTGEDAQIVLTSDAPLQRTQITCRRVVGYLAVPFDFEEAPEPLVGGACRIPIASLRTGVRELDDLLHGVSMLRVEESPEITFEIAAVRGARRVSKPDEPVTYELEIDGKLGILDAMLDLVLPARLTLLPFTWQTMARFPGDLVALRVSMELPLTTLRIGKPNPRMQQRMADTLQLEVYLLANSVPPEKSLDPRISASEQTAILKYFTLLRDFEQSEEAAKLGYQILRDFPNNVELLRRVVRETLDDPEIRDRDMTFLLKLARRANEITEDKDPQTLALLARVLYHRGEFAEAAAIAGKAFAAGEHLSEPVVMELAKLRSQCELASIRGEP